MTKFLLILTNGTGMCVIRSNLRNYAFYDESAEVKEKEGKKIPWSNHYECM